ncbi:MAG: hypothetical protein KDD43_12310, partial [Bdellovibrionales bacterium]|nr:hypothetical protein [Bdellovibrionales bacterium]
MPEIPEAQNLAPFLPLNFIVQQFSRELRKRFDASCDDQGIWNWWFMKSMKWAYRMDQANRRSLIMALSNNLARGAENIVDLDGNKIVDGVRVTLQKNLSWSQSQSQPSIKYFNSMTGIAQENWLREIYINPFFYWLDFDTRGNLGCRATSNGKQYFEFPFNIAHPDWGFINNNLDGGVLQSDTAEPDSGPYRLTIGYEKNPWVMVYSAVEARTTTRNIFHPFGPPIELRARSYAKPFGGRMGPWYADQWPSGAQESTGQKVDIRGQPRVGWADGLLANKDDPDRFPNYSRFPGDPLGLASVLAQSASTNLRNQFQGSLDFYFDVYSSHVLGGTNDPLAWNRKLNNGNIRPRMYEIAAIAPDLFDITYYSIDPNYWGNYGSRIERARQALGLPEDLPVRADLGSRGGVDELRNFSVQQQMELANRPDLRTNDAFYYIRNKVHLLTGWLPGPQANTYFPADGQSSLPVGDSKFPFGMCPKPDYST